MNESQINFVIVVVIVNVWSLGTVEEGKAK